MNTKQDPKELAIALMSRSRCSVQVACVIADAHGVFAWGWNSAGPNGMGLCAERHAISRANRYRLADATYYVAAKRRRNNAIVTALPCEKCCKKIEHFGYYKIEYRDKNGLWRLG